MTCLARGAEDAPPAGTTFVRADRDRPDAYELVSGSDWDAVIDLARQPGQVRRAVEALADRTSSYVFISTASVYADNSLPGANEDAELLAPLDSDVLESMENYGEAKVACERQVLARLGAERSLIIRPGLIGGPGDASDRSGYWPLRFARPAVADGSVLVPDTPDLATQVIDVRDLASWVLAAAWQSRGIFDATGDRVRFEDHIAVAREVAGHTGPIVAAGADWLTAHDVAPWMGVRSLPLWLPDPAWAGLGARDNRAAHAAGLSLRPLAETLADTLAWELGRETHRPRRAGLADRDEHDLIRLLRAGAQPG